MKIRLPSFVFICLMCCLNVLPSQNKEFIIIIIIIIINMSAAGLHVYNVQSVTGRVKSVFRCDIFPAKVVLE